MATATIERTATRTRTWVEEDEDVVRRRERKPPKKPSPRERFWTLVAIWSIVMVGAFFIYKPLFAVMAAISIGGVGYKIVRWVKQRRQEAAEEAGPVVPPPTPLGMVRPDALSPAEMYRLSAAANARTPSGPIIPLPPVPPLPASAVTILPPVPPRERLLQTLKRALRPHRPNRDGGGGPPNDPPTATAEIGPDPGLGLGWLLIALALVLGAMLHMGVPPLIAIPLCFGVATWIGIRARRGWF